VVEDVVPAEVVVTRYRTRSGYCKQCKRRVESRHAEQPPPADVPHAQLGLTALSVAAALKHAGERNPSFARSPFRKKLKRAAKDLLRLKGRWDELTDDAYCMRASRLADRLDNLAKTVSEEKDVARLANRLKRHASALAEFLLVRDLPGDNNAAERAIRPAVLIRKVSGGHRGGTTATASAAVMSVLRTAKQQGKNLIATLKHLVQRHLNGQPCQPGDLFPAPSG